MSGTEELITSRLILRQWAPSDAPAMAAIDRTLDVTRYLGKVNDDELESFVPTALEHWNSHGYGPWAVQLRGIRDDGPLIGAVGVGQARPPVTTDLDAPELGWRLSPSAWGRGYATEAALAARDDAFDRLGLSEVMSIIHPEDGRSRRVAIKLGMTPHGRVEFVAESRLLEIWRLSERAGVDDRVKAKARHWSRQVPGRAFM